MVAAALGGAAIERSRDTPAAEQPRATANTVKPRVHVYGDSLVVQSEPYLDSVAGSLGLTVQSQAFGGIAPCDALEWLADDLRGASPDVVVFAFSGNSLTDCMRLPDGAFATGTDLVAAYREDIELAITIATNGGAPFILASPPASQQYPEAWERIDVLYRELAAAHAPYAQYVDAGSDIAPSGQFEPVQRCLPFELQIALTKDACGSGDGTISVRSGDGVHFCGDGATKAGVCSTYSSGAARYAISLVTAAKLELEYLATLDEIAPRETAQREVNR